MTLNQLQTQHARLAGEIDALAHTGDADEARLAHLQRELDRINRDLSHVRQLVRSAPLLSDEVPGSALPRR